MILGNLVRRNCRLYFRDKGMFFTSLITPAILLVLYGTFLSDVFRDSFLMAFPPEMKVDTQVVDGLVAGQVVSSILAVSCVTVAFCSNFLMVQDKANGTLRDLRMAPVKPATLALGYFLASLISTLLICLLALGLCLLYMGSAGWYLTAGDVAALVLDVILLVLFGTALSSVINFFLSSQGQISAVGTVVSSGYGFFCGAYMPISSFGSGLQTVISFLPGTYGTGLVRNHAMGGALEALGLPAESLREFRDMLDCNLYFQGSQVSPGAMYAILCGTIGVLLIAYILLHKFRKK